MDEDDDSKIFPQRLMEILGEERNQESICWLPHGRAFVVRNRKLFSDTVMPRYFSRKAKYSSFARKLNRWNFVRVSSGPELGAYYHEFFLRDKPHLAAQMFCKNARTKLAMANETSSPGLVAGSRSASVSPVPPPSDAIEVPHKPLSSLVPLTDTQPEPPKLPPKPTAVKNPVAASLPPPQHMPPLPALPSDIPLSLLSAILSKDSTSLPSTISSGAEEDSATPTPSRLLQQAQYANLLLERQIQILQREQAKRMVIQALQNKQQQEAASSAQQAQQTLTFEQQLAQQQMGGGGVMTGGPNGAPFGQPMGDASQISPQRLMQMRHLMQLQREKRRKDCGPVNPRASAA